VSPRVVLVTEPRYALEHTARIVRWAAEALGEARLAVQLRDKASSDAELAVAARALRDVTREAGALLVINGHEELAHAVGADGVHLPSSDAPLALRVAAVRARLGEHAFVSTAAHTDAEVLAASRAGATAALVSPIFATPGKGPARGVAAIASARSLVDAARRAPSLLVFALGGVTPENAVACGRAGADGVAVIRALYDATGEAGVKEAALARARGGEPPPERDAGTSASFGDVMTTYDETLKVTTEILKKHVDADRAIRPNDHIQNDLGLDSLGVMELVADIEDRFSVTIPNDVLSDIATVDDVAKALVKLAAEQGGTSTPS
jgi:acyl carrier protein